MVVDRNGRDPEIHDLTMRIHGLSGQIQTLVTEIDKTVVLLADRAARTDDTKEQGPQ
jgi:hypothetical protein